MSRMTRWQEVRIQAPSERRFRDGGEPAATKGVAPAVFPDVDAGPNGLASAHQPLGLLAALRRDPRLAVGDNSIRCLICGRLFRQLTNTHLRAHDTGPAEYKRCFGYNRGRPLMCRDLLRLYSERAVKSGLAARIRRRRILIEPELRRLGGSRAITLEELLTRRDSRRRSEDSGGSRAVRSQVS